MPLRDMPPRFTLPIFPEGGWAWLRGVGCGAMTLILAQAGGAAPKSPGFEPLSASEIKSMIDARYVGDAACAACHADKATSYRATAHARTSRPPSAESILGSFAAGANILRTANPNLLFAMEAHDGGFFQTGVMRMAEGRGLTRSERIAVVVGSGRKGQTYLFWDGPLLLQLPVSYLTQAHRWVNSPGYVDGVADFDRPIPPRCLECHASRFAARPPPVNHYEPASLVLGISCEKCHGPGAEHVARYRGSSGSRPGSGSAIVNPAKLARARAMDVCALCHAGAGEALTPALSFTPGDELSRHLVFAPQPAGAHIDVHASQVQLLERSRCFQGSATMNCSTCHDVHQPQRDVAGFAAKCLSCHQVESCRVFPQQGRRIANECVTCHMPVEQTGQIVIAGAANDTQARVRNHRIAIYPGITLPATTASSGGLK